MLCDLLRLCKLFSCILSNLRQTGLSYHPLLNLQRRLRVEMVSKLVGMFQAMDGETQLAKDYKKFG